MKSKIHKHKNHIKMRMSKKTFIIAFAFTASLAFSQVAIGKDNVTNTSVSLEFGTGNKGIVLPWVNGTTNSSPYITGYTGTETIVDGTIVCDVSEKKVKYLKEGTWFDLTGSPTFPLTVKDASNNDVTITAFSTIDTTLQDALTEQTTAKAAIGADGATDTKPGILVLTDKDKAMILPKMDSPHLNIKNPAPGMMAYDTNKKQLAVYNGTVWSFWKP